MKRLLIALCAALSATPATGSAGAADPSTMALVRAAGFDVAMLDALAYSNGRVLFEKEQYDRLSPCIAQHGPMRAFVESPVARKLGGVVSDQGVLVVIKQTILEACAGR